jgi:hypothetical protein
MNVTTARLFVALVMCSALLFAAGCRTAAVERHTGRVETAISAGEPPSLVRAPGAEDPWYRSLQVVLDEKPKDDKELESLVEQGKPAAKSATLEVLQEIQKAIDAQRKPSDKWSVLSMTCGKTRRGSELQFNADVVITNLYARRPTISFNNVPLDLCVAKLCRECGIQDSQPKGYNPRIYWSKLNVSAIEALEAILGSHGFERRFSDVNHHVTLRVQDYPTRAGFVEAASNAILEKGKLLNQARPALLVVPTERSSESKSEPKPSQPKP